MESSEKPSDGQADLERIDEILQVMYWLRGEGLASYVSADELSRWIALKPSSIERLLARLLHDGLLRDVGEPRASARRFALTDSGVVEGGRRFADEFADFIHRGHGECSDPNCDCHQSGPEHCVHRHE